MNRANKYWRRTNLDVYVYGSGGRSYVNPTSWLPQATGVRLMQTFTHKYTDLLVQVGILNMSLYSILPRKTPIPTY